MAKTISATNARVHFGEVMREAVEKNETFFVERAGRPRVVILSREGYDRLCSGEPPREHWRVLMDQDHALIREHHGDQPMPNPADIINDMREERDAELLAALL